MGTGEIEEALAYQRVKYLFEVASGGGRNKLRPSRGECSGRAGARPSREDNLRELGAVDAAIGGENGLAEARDNGRDGRAARRFQLVNDIVRV